ncbi:hypothetical protein H6F90_17015 [Trichocoleus sp. FACHB-591]|uniref:hypothetical protein n=1 Tax=Trichocoleus sp. FACHB-591 TaxID=2692872 RepID=UPI0016891B0F|nr:hypothetical protein [Trichocoleus sp. FACHB-591]MBD2096806.1 hypothetical protein [Trichocoleus sp. FACHB-591]
MEPTTLVITGAVTALIIEASKEAGKSIAKLGTDLIGKLVCLIRYQFRSAQIEKVLTEVQQEPNETNKIIFSNMLSVQLSKDKNFANSIIELLRQIKATDDQRIQSILVDLEAKGNIEIKGVVQRSHHGSSSNQEALKNIKGKNIRIENITQEN